VSVLTNNYVFLKMHSLIVKKKKAKKRGMCFVHLGSFLSTRN